MACLDATRCRETYYKPFTHIDHIALTRVSAAITPLIDIPGELAIKLIKRHHDFSNVLEAWTRYALYAVVSE